MRLVKFQSALSERSTCPALDCRTGVGLNGPLRDRERMREESENR